ncbi:10940_t:CDS:1, partial [Funneliformis caledonium]
YEFKCNNPDKDNILLKNDNYSFTTDNTYEILIIPSINDSNNEDIYEFLFNYKAFQNVKKRASLDKYNIDITWKDIDSIEKDSIEKSLTIASNDLMKII